MKPHRDIRAIFVVSRGSYSNLNDSFLAVTWMITVVISEYYNLRGRCLGHLVMAAEKVEEALGLPPTLSNDD
ncbi:MAG: hypothetical protein FJ308_02100 [Planctomycetes bacterium]|nr:hypothetical protein [Planctomycetota bacterium]